MNQAHKRAGLLRRDPEALSNWYEVALVVELKIEQAWPNCPCYIHTMTRKESAEHVSRQGVGSCIPEWKSMDAFSDVMPPAPHTLLQGDGDQANNQ